jgi:hypothetical protein
MVFCMVESKIPPIVYVFAFWVVKMLIYDFFFARLSWRHGIIGITNCVKIKLNFEL